MIKFIKIPDPNNTFDQTYIEVHTSHVSLPEILEEFENFLRGCGFVFDGKIEILDDQIIDEDDE